MYEMKIAIVGYSGGGKSTLARFLSKKLHTPVLYLDTVHWLPGWQERPREETREIVKTFLDENEAWVIDGSYGKVHYERRMQEADKIIFLNFNRFTCMRRAFKRRKEYKGKNRFSMTEGCEERISWQFFWWLLWEGRTKDRREKFTILQKNYPNKVIILKNQRQLNKFTREIEEGLWQ
jgi:adenylate kinase family enzyme